MKRILFIILLVIIVVAVAAYIYTRTKPTPQPTGAPVPITTITSLSTIPRKIESAPTRVTFSYSGPQVSFPKLLPAYTLSYPQNLQDRTNTLAKQWGFTSGVKKPVPYVYDWIDNDKQLTYNDKAKSVSFSLFSVPPANSPLSSLTPQGVFSTLTSIGLLSENFSFTETARQVIGEKGEGGESANNVTVIAYQSSITGLQYPVYFSGFTQTNAEIRVDQEGKVLSFSAYVSPQINKSQNHEILGTTEQILQELNSQKGFLAGLQTTVSTYPFEEPASYTAVTITKISLAYLFIPEESRFVPIAVVEGTGNGPTLQKVRYYVRISS